MKRVFHIFLVVIACIGISAAQDKWKTNIYESSASRINLNVTRGTKEEINLRVQQVLKGKEKWCDEFIKICPGKLKGAFTFKDKQRVVGIGYDLNSAKARKKADENNLAAFDDAGLNKLGVYATVLKVKTKNGYFIYAMVRSPVSEGFKFEDFKDKSDDVLEGIDDDG